jgi:hypothetical protein
LLARNIRLRYRAFFHWEDRLTGIAVEEIKKTHLGRLRHGRDLLTISPNSDQARLGRQVIIPDIVMNNLKMPDQFTGRSA